MVTFVPGRLPPHPEVRHPRLYLGEYLTAALPAPPASVDWHSLITDWPMYLNDQLGCCTEAMVGHIIEGASTYGAGSTAMITDDDVLTAYRRVSGYTPGNPATDHGAVLQDVYGDWRKTGVGGHKNLLFAQVAPSDLLEVRQAIDLFGAAGLGIVVTQSMMDDFNAGKPWMRATGENLGGHAVPVVGYDPAQVFVVTWGRVQPMSWGCFQQVTEEAWAAVLPEWFNAQGRSPAGLDLNGLGEAFVALTGEPNPFHVQPEPGPQPAPPPAPGPGPDPDVALAASARGWLSLHHSGANKAFAHQVQSWLAAKSL